MKLLKKMTINIPEKLKNENFRFILLSKNSKIPIEENWQNKNNYKFTDNKLLNHLKNDENYGVLSGFGKLRILDIDEKELSNFYKTKIQTYIIETCGKTNHFYFISDYEDNIVFEKGELRSKNMYVVGANCYVIDKNKNHEGKYSEINNIEIQNISKEDLLKLIPSNSTITKDIDDNIFEDINIQENVDKDFIEKNILRNLGEFTRKLITENFDEKSIILSGFKSRSERDGKVITSLLLNGFGEYIKSIFKLYPVGDKYLEHNDSDKYLLHSIKNCRKYSGVIDDNIIKIEKEIETINERVLRNKIDVYLEKISKIEKEILQSYFLGILAFRIKIPKKELYDRLRIIAHNKEEKNPISMLDLLSKDLPEIKYFMNPLIPKGQLLLFGGKPGTFKSMLVLSLALSIKNNTSFLEKFSVNENPKILLYDLENGEATIWWRLKYLINGLKIDQNKLKDFHIEYKFNKDNIKKEVEFAKSYDIIILDSYRRFLKGTENDSEITDNFFRDYLNTLKELGKTIIIIHHFKKANMKEITDEDLMDIFRGSSDIPAQFDIIYSVTKEDDIENMETKKINFDVSIINVKNRHGLPIKNFAFNVNKNDEKQSTDFTFIGYKRITSPKEKIKLKILELINIKKCVDRKDVCDLISGLTGSPDVNMGARYLKELVNVGKIQQPIHGKYATLDYVPEKKTKKPQNSLD